MTWLAGNRPLLEIYTDLCKHSQLLSCFVRTHPMAVLESISKEFAGGYKIPSVSQFGFSFSFLDPLFKHSPQRFLYSQQSSFNAYIHVYNALPQWNISIITSPISFLTLQRSSLLLLNLFTKPFCDPMALDEKFFDFILRLTMTLRTWTLILTLTLMPLTWMATLNVTTIAK